MPYEQRNEMDQHRPNPFPGNNERTYDQDNVSWSPGEKLTLPIVQKTRGWFLIACLLYEGIGFTLNELIFFYRIWLHGMTPLSWGIVCVRGLATVLNVLGVCAIWNWKNGALSALQYISSSFKYQQSFFSKVHFRWLYKVQLSFLSWRTIPYRMLWCDTLRKSPKARSGLDLASSRCTPLHNNRYGIVAYAPLIGKWKYFN